MFHVLPLAPGLVVSAFGSMPLNFGEDGRRLSATKVSQSAAKVKGPPILISNAYLLLDVYNCFRLLFEKQQAFFFLDG